MVEATQWVPGVDAPAGQGANPDMLCGCVLFNGKHEPHLHTIHGNSYVALEPGDWIIAEPDGEHYYPCKPDIFEATYDAIEEAKT